MTTIFEDINYEKLQFRYAKDKPEEGLCIHHTEARKGTDFRDRWKWIEVNVSGWWYDGPEDDDARQYWFSDLGEATMFKMVFG
jgi:hypothetical protein